MRLNKSAVLLSAAVLAVGLTGAASATASADVAGLSIAQVGYNAYGSDTVWNRNQEFIDVKNDGSTSGPVDVAGLVIADQWGKSHAGPGDNPGGCNTVKVTALQGIATGGTGSVMLPVGDIIRVYSGRGTAGVSDNVHTLFLNSRCGYHGHIWGNGGDTAWITLGGNSESFPFDFDNGYTVKP